LLLLLVLLLASPAMLLGLGQPDVLNDFGEARTLATSVATWERSGLSWYERLEPYYNHQPQRSRPPAVIWMQSCLFAFTGDRDHPPAPDILALRARLLSVLLALTTVAAVFWAGKSLGGDTTAALAALLVAANPIFVHFARLAAPPIYYLAVMVISIAAALWALRPLRTAPTVWRQGIGWSICGVTFGLAILITGPIALVTIIVPVLTILLLCPNRYSHLLGLLAAVLIGVLMVLPWGLYVHEHDANVWTTWLSDVRPHGGLTALGLQIATMLGLLLVVTLPWTLWVGAALGQPFGSRTTPPEMRARLRLTWCWFVAVVALLLVLPVEPFGAGLGDLLAVVPALSVLVAHLFGQYTDLAAQGRHPRSWRVMRWPHTGLLVVLSVGVPVFLERNIHYTAHQSTWSAVALGIALLGLLALSVRWMIHNFPGRSVILWALWSVILMTASVLPYTHGPMSHSALPGQAQELHNLASQEPGTPLFLVTIPNAGSAPPDSAAPADAVDPALLFYSGLYIPAVTADQLYRGGPRGPAYVLLPAEARQGQSPPLIAGHGPPTFAMLLDSAGLALWRSPPAPPPPASARASTGPASTPATGPAPLR
jgi:4-amino-4-deoxy-L-arabinose transferase-like glycosyltransferase